MGQLVVVNGHPEKLGREEMIADVAGAESQSSVGVTFLRSLDGYLAVFYNLVLIADLADDPDSFCGERLLNNLQWINVDVIFNKSQ